MSPPARVMRAGDGHGPIDAILARHSDDLMAIPGVLGVGQALSGGTPCIRLYIRDHSVRPHLPPSLDGVPVEAVVTGPITPRRDP